MTSMKLRLFTLGLVLCISALAAPNERARCARHSSACKPVTPATAAMPSTSEQSALLISHLLYI